MSAHSGAALKQKLYETVLLLASEEGRVEERLAHAYFNHIQALPASLFPAELRAEYEALCAELEQMFPEPGRTDGVDQNRAVDLAQRIILIYDAIIK